MFGFGRFWEATPIAEVVWASEDEMIPIFLGVVNVRLPKENCLPAKMKGTGNELKNQV